MVENYFKTLSVVGTIPFLLGVWYLGKVTDALGVIEKHLAVETVKEPKLKVVK